MPAVRRAATTGCLRICAASWIRPHRAPSTARNPGTIVNLADVRAARSRSAGLELVQHGPDPIVPHCAAIVIEVTLRSIFSPSPHPIRSRKPDNRICVWRLTTRFAHRM